MIFTRYYIPIAVLIFLSYIVSVLGASNSYNIYGIPGTVFLFFITFILQVIFFIPSYLLRTEKFYDISACITYITVVSIGLYHSSDLSSIKILVSSMVIFWSIRLGFFLFRRILRDGVDRRFSKIRLSFHRFLLSWILQATWIYIVSSPALFIITRIDLEAGFNLLTYLGFVIWFLGLTIEVIADTQKSIFRMDPQNSSGFITSGLWSLCRHPNYFGEILLWIGFYVSVLPFIDGTEHVVIFSPLLTYYLLTRVSGINLLEEYAENKWGDMDLYIIYRNSTPKLFPFVGKK